MICDMPTTFNNQYRKSTPMQIVKNTNGSPWLYNLKKIWNPSWFQGSRKRTGYFEGWYFKLISQDGAHSFAFIPGISLASGDDHSFVQAINGKTGESWYIRFPLEAFSYSNKGFYVEVDNNSFSTKHITLNIENEKLNVSGTVKWFDPIVFKASLRKPGIMGWYRYMPFMECYHGVVSLNHTTSGSLQINDVKHAFDQGKGYIEKDWGSSMPSSWIWMQSNHFDPSKTSFMLSVAQIPWLKSTFTGFLGFLFCNGRRYDFATYTGAKVTIRNLSGDTVDLMIISKRFTLEVLADKGASGALKAPVGGNMQRVIHESIDASIHLKLKDRHGQILFQGTGRNAGLEMVGDVETLR